jgi:hypothetical protein
MKSEIESRHGIVYRVVACKKEVSILSNDLAEGEDGGHPLDLCTKRSPTVDEAGNGLLLRNHNNNNSSSSSSGSSTADAIISSGKAIWSPGTKHSI